MKGLSTFDEFDELMFHKNINVSQQYHRIGHGNSAEAWSGTISRSPGGWTQEQNSKQSDKKNDRKDSAEVGGNGKEEQRCAA